MSQTSNTQRGARATCRVCKRPLPRFQPRGRKRRYCSPACKLRAYRARKKGGQPQKRNKRPALPSGETASCLVCERPLTQPPRGRKMKYCCVSCKQKAYRNRRNVMRETYRQALRNNLLRLNHKSIEWYTPPEYIGAVYEVLGSIELDPASSAAANQSVGALRYFDLESNGLLQEWKSCSLFLNPPHDRKYPIGPWIAKLLQEYQEGHVLEAIALVDAATETGWFAPLYNFALCFVRGRINFVRGDGRDTHGQIQGCCLPYKFDLTHFW